MTTDAERLEYQEIPTYLPHLTPEQEEEVWAMCMGHRFWETERTWLYLLRRIDMANLSHALDFLLGWVPGSGMWRANALGALEFNFFRFTDSAVDLLASDTERGVPLLIGPDEGTALGVVAEGRNPPLTFRFCREVKRKEENRATSIRRRNSDMFNFMNDEGCHLFTPRKLAESAAPYFELQGDRWKLKLP